MMSEDTSGTSLYSTIRFIGPSAASRTAVLTSPTETGFFMRQVRSTIEPSGQGTRIASPSAFPFHAGAAPPKVLVRRVGQPLVVGVGVDRRHHALLDSEALVQDLCDRREAVGR